MAMLRPMRPAPTAAKRATVLACLAQQPGHGLPVQPRQPERLEGARAPRQVAAQKSAGDREQSVRDRCFDAGPPRHRGEEGQAELDVSAT